MIVRCTCDKWVRNAPLEKSRDAYLHVHGMPWTGDMYAYCPWCGSKVTEKETNKATAKDEPGSVEENQKQ